MSTPTIQIDPTKIPDAIGAIEKAGDPFLPPKLRAAIYAIAGFIAIAAAAAAPVVGGVIGEVLSIIGASAAAIIGTTALSHVSK